MPTPHIFTAPASWGSFLINGDDSGMDDDQIRQAKHFLAKVGMGWPVDASDEGFSWTNDAFGWLGLHMGADIAVYTFLKD